MYIYVYTDDDRRTRSKEEQEFDEAVARFLLIVVAIGIKKASPHVKQFWDEKARPAIAATWEKRPRRRESERRREPDPEPPAVEPMVVEATLIAEPFDQLAVASSEYRANMSSAEAQARDLIALAAKAFSDEQMRLLANADIDDGGHLSALEHGLAQLPPHQVGEIIGTLEIDPAALTQAPVDAGTVRAVTRMERARTALKKRG